MHKGVGRVPEDLFASVGSLVACQSGKHIQNRAPVSLPPADLVFSKRNS